MRSSKSRSRSKSNRNRPNGANVVNRVFDSSGPEGKVRGTPQQIIDKYNQLARDAQLGNDRVAAENFQQHAEHYLRMLNEAQREIEVRREEQERQNRERQAERDRERAERLERQEREAAAKAKAKAEEGDDAVVDPLGNGGDEVGASSGLVETPEGNSEPETVSEEPAEKPKKAPQRKPRARKNTDGEDAPKPRSRRKPKAEAAEEPAQQDNEPPADDSATAAQ
ncbi:DUF4167 domain-containing protein [Epibacterium sp. SM1969]|uniref:DUF4167 domain-containing protein n=1 Tax=Tritonibacter aquimaris TaxID=2663379 RepID=A0A844AQI3_9RHOB|nr:DUF4167 domain-containing protein [Tritonibacter aquimaris]MQY41248.1 DUF4167 domain-containing protein [Tritonibacter aquimaris]